MFKFRLLKGKHAQKENGVVKIYKQGDKLQHKTDLAAKFNSPGSQKFEKLEDDAPAPAPAPAPVPASAPAPSVNDDYASTVSSNGGDDEDD